MNGSFVTKRGNTLFVALPPFLQRPIDGGCSCDWCKAHPHAIPAWDTLAVDDRGQSRAWTIHFPDMGK